MEHFLADGVESSGKQVRSALTKSKALAKINTMRDWFGFGGMDQFQGHVHGHHGSGKGYGHTHGMVNLARTFDRVMLRRE